MARTKGHAEQQATARFKGHATTSMTTQRIRDHDTHLHDAHKKGKRPSRASRATLSTGGHGAHPGPGMTRIKGHPEQKEPPDAHQDMARRRAPRARPQDPEATERTRTRRMKSTTEPQGIWKRSKAIKRKRKNTHRERMKEGEDAEEEEEEKEKESYRFVRANNNFSRSVNKKRLGAREVHHGHEAHQRPQMHQRVQLTCTKGADLRQGRGQ